MNDEGAFEYDDSGDIAIIGMAGRFPRAANVAEFWQNLRRGDEGIAFFSDDELEAVGLRPEELSDPGFVRAKAVLDDIDLFDAAFFNIPAREAEWMDPQQRLFLECAWQAVEHAGYDAAAYDGLIALYAGVGPNTYIMSRPLGVLNPGDLFQLVVANDKDHLATRVSYKLNLRGESITVQTACSTSLVAVHLACQSLLGGQSDMALAGGATIHVPQKTGYFYQEGMILSPDGHCRPFDRHAQGTVDGSGVAVVVLKRLADALRDNDAIIAVIKGSAINNDGNLKVGYTAPSVEGQADVIAKALAIAGLSADQIGYVEAHGTGTTLGDPIEVEALTRVFRRHTDRKGYCALGSVKSNVGHLDTAAGVTGLIKAALALRQGEIPPTLHFEKANPAIDLDNSPFFVNNRLIEWPSEDAPRRAGVSSFGIGGTNVHVVLEEAPARAASGPSRPAQLIALSAKTATALEQSALELADHLEADAGINLADAAFTRNVGRASFNQRRYIVAADRDEAARALRAPRASEPAPHKHRGVVFMFPGQGAQAVNMAREIYESEPTFRRAFDECAEIVEGTSRQDIRQVVYPNAGDVESAQERLARPGLTLPSLFAVEYALAQLWMSWGIRPAAMIGHSFGEYVAACVAGVFSVEDALRISVERGRLIDQLPEGAMLAARLTEAEAGAFVNEPLSLASVNSRVSSVISGPVEAIAELEQELARRQVGCRRLNVRRAYHSAMVEPILEAFEQVIAGVKLNAPQIPYGSSLTGKLITAEQATDPRYWAEQMRRAVRFATGLDTLTADGYGLFIEVGPDQGLCALAKQHFERRADLIVTPSLKRAAANQSDSAVLTRCLGEAWRAGNAVDWAAYYQGEQRQRVALPTYPFDRRRFWIEAATAAPRDDGEAVQFKAAAAGAVVSQMNAASPDTVSTRHAVDRSRLTVEYSEPRDEMDKAIAEVWGDVLGVERIGIHDSFFDLGGDSLLATQVYSRLRQTVAPDVTLRQVLANLTIAELADSIQQATASAAGGAADSRRIRPVTREREIPLSFAQQRLWFIDQTEPGSPIYNLATAVRLTGQLDVDALTRSFDEIFRRHEALRTTFTSVDGRAAQVVHSHTGFRLDVTDLGKAADKAAAAVDAAALRRAIAEESARSFDLEAGPLMRVRLFKLDLASHVLVITAHHIVSDAWSVGVLIGELTALYEAYSLGRPSPLAALAVQYPDYAVWQREQIAGDVLEAQLAYWKKRLAAPLPLLNLPFARPRPAIQTFRGARQSLALPAGLTESLKAISRGEGATLYMTLLAAFQTLLYRHTGQTDVVIGSPVAGRQQAELEGLIGVFINMLVLRTDLGGDPPFDELLGRVRQATLEAYANQDVPFERVVDAVQPERNLGHTPLFQALFNFQNTPLTAIEISGLMLSPVESDEVVARFDLTLNMAETPDGLIGDLEYNTDLFDDADVARLVGHFKALLEDIAARPTARLNALQIQTGDERQAAAAAEKQREAAERAILKRARRKTVSLSPQQLVKMSPLNGGPLPLVIAPEVSGVDLAAWAAQNRETIQSHLRRHGAVLFRGFRIKTAADFKQLAASVSPDLLEYRYRSTPRTEVGERVYTSTEYPADQQIPLHNENAYTRAWPMKLWFYCALPSTEGGETPLADSRRVFEMIAPEIRERFTARRVMYVRNYGDGIDLPWQEVFQTGDRDQVEAYCRREGLEFAWRTGGRLQTRQVCQAVMAHPQTGEMVWFNQAHLFHLSALEPELRRSLTASFGADELPRNALYGDGMPIEDDVLEEIRGVYRRAAVSFPWQADDVVLVDNMLVAHGRNSYVGPRRILVAMAEPFSPNGHAH